MKNLVIILAFILFGSLATAQKHVATKVSSSSTEYSLSENGSSKIAISVKNVNEQYAYNARFAKEKTLEARKEIVSVLGEPKETDRESLWEGKGYTVILRAGKVSMDMNKRKVTKSFQVKFEDLGNHVSVAIGSNKIPAPPMPPSPPKPPKAPKAPWIDK